VGDAENKNGNGAEFAARNYWFEAGIINLNRWL
jgi:hypothetical protein